VGQKGRGRRILFWWTGVSVQWYFPCWDAQAFWAAAQRHVQYCPEALPHPSGWVTVGQTSVSSLASGWRSEALAAPGYKQKGEKSAYSGNQHWAMAASPAPLVPTPTSLNQRPHELSIMINSYESPGFEGLAFNQDKDKQLVLGENDPNQALGIGSRVSW
jgi:hypothetical protein